MRLPSIRGALGASRRPAGKGYVFNDVDLPILAVRQNVIIAPDGVWAAYTLGQVPWDFTSPQQQASLLASVQLRWAELAGKRIKIRLTQHPFPHVAWASAHDKASTNRLHDVEGGESWADVLEASQRLAINAGLDVPIAYLMVRVSTTRIDPARIGVLLSSQSVSRDYQDVRAELVRVTDSVARDGLWATPATARAISWLTHVSLAIGVPAPDVQVGDGRINPHDRGLFTSAVGVVAEPYAASAIVLAHRNGRGVERHVTVLSMGAVEDRHPTGLVPWMAYARRLPFPVEMVATFDVDDGGGVVRALEARRRVLTDQQAHYWEHDEEPPAEVSRALEVARRGEDEARSGSREVACRLIGPVRAAITGVTAEEVRRRVQAFTAAYARDQRIGWTHTHGQAALLSEFVPTAPIALPGTERWMPAPFAATAVPNAATRVGTPSGPMLGSTFATGRSAVLFDPAFGPEHERSGLILTCGGLGSGKSALTGILAEQAARLGRKVVLLDPSGPLAQLATLTHLRRDARVVNLTSARPGTLNPYTLIPNPQRSQYSDGEDGDTEYNQDFAAAAAERRELTIDALTMLLPGAMISGPNGGTTIAVLRSAVANAPSHLGATPWDVISLLEQEGEHGKAVAQILRDASEQRGASLIFPATNQDSSGVTGDALLTVITTPGLTPPAPGSRREYWTWAEQMAAPVLHLAARLAARTMYGDREPKLIGVDEGALTGRGDASLGHFMDRGARDSRKWNAAFLIGSQNPRDFLPISEEIGNLIGAMFIGRMDSDASAAAALHLAKVPVGLGYEAMLTGLSAGQFLLRDWTNPPQLVQVALNHRPELAAVLNTTPHGATTGTTFNAQEVFA